MVSPLYKQGNNARPVSLGEGPESFPVAPDGDTVGFQSVGAFAQPENYVVYKAPLNDYLSQRGASGWSTVLGARAGQAHIQPVSGRARERLLARPALGAGELRPHGKLRRRHVRRAQAGRSVGPRDPDLHARRGANEEGHVNGYLGGSSDLSRVFIAPAERLAIL